MHLIIYTDGGARGNPGPAAIGVVICLPAEAVAKAGNNQGKVLKKYAQSIAQATNNEAEYQAIIFALKKVKALFGKKEARNMHLEVRTDSELAVRQLDHQYKIQEENLQPLFLRVWNLMLDFKEVKFIFILRPQNKEADRLVNQTLDNDNKNQALF